MHLYLVYKFLGLPKLIPILNQQKFNILVVVVVISMYLRICFNRLDHDEHTFCTNILIVIYPFKAEPLWELAGWL